MLQISQKTSLKEIREEIAKLREQKGKEKETLQLIEKALSYGHEFVVNLLWEKALTLQHLIRNEDVKLEKKDKILRKEHIQKLKDVIGQTKYYIVRFDLDSWKSKMYVFMGKVDDFLENYESAINNYKKALTYAKNDPDNLKGVPTDLEIMGHLSFSMIMSGQIQKGYDMAIDTYRKFDKDERAQKLKANDYYTWAVWKSGVMIRNVGAIVTLGSDIGKEDFSDWIYEVKGFFIPEKNFSYRIGALNALKKKLFEIKAR